jgi:hypothetical protein
MKKFIFGILAACLLIGLPFIVMDALAQENSNFKIPSGYEKVTIHLNEKVRNMETVYTKELKEPTEVNIVMQSDSDIQNKVVIASDQKILGSNGKEQTFQIKDVVGYSYLTSKIIFKPGIYTIKVTSAKTEGDIVIGFKENTISSSEFERLLKIESGELNHAPEGYEEVYHTDLSGLNVKDQTVYSLTLDRTRKIGICIYTNATKGNCSVDFIGETSQYYGLINPGIQSICDRLENTLSKGTYEIKLSSNNADGQVYIFLKK